MHEFLSEACPVMMSRTHGEAGSLLPYFPGYKYEFGKNIYRGEDVGKGGHVYSEPGMYIWDILLHGLCYVVSTEFRRFQNGIKENCYSEKWYCN